LLVLVSGVVGKSGFRRDGRAFVAVRVNLRELVKITRPRLGRRVVEISFRDRLVRQSLPENKRQIFIHRTINVIADDLAVHLLQDFFLQLVLESLFHKLSLIL